MLGAEVEHHDDQSQAGMVDALLTYPDGTLGALEVTTLGDERVIHARSLIVGKNFHVEGARFAWHAAVSHANAAEFRANVPHLILACEEAEAGSIRHLHAVDPVTEALLDWAEEVDLTLISLPTDPRTGIVFVSSPGVGGFIDKTIPGFVTWVRDQLVTNRAAMRSLAKLRRSARPRQHLFLRVHQSALDDGMFMNVNDAEGLPSEPLETPGSLTDVWLMSEWMRNGPLHWDGVRWRRESGWHDEEFHEAIARG